MSILWGAAGILVLGAIVGAIYWIKRGVSNAVSLGERDAALKVERERIATMERAAAAERARELEAFDAKAAAVTGAPGAAELLREQFPRRRGTPTD